MTKKLTLTPNCIDALRNGSITDTQTPGLLIEALGSGKLVWKYRRRVSGSDTITRLRLGHYPRYSIADARAWGRENNEMVEAGVNPSERRKSREVQESLTVDRCHALYMEAVAKGQHRAVRTQSAKGIKPRTISEKLALYDRNIRGAIGSRYIGDITQDALISIIRNMSLTAPVQSNRMASELRVFFNWCCGLRARDVGINLQSNPAGVLGELWTPEAKRTRWLDHDELPLFLRALALEDRLYRRALLIILLTGCRAKEVMAAPMSEFRGGRFIISPARTKNSQEHPITMGPWLAKLCAMDGNWLIPSSRLEDAPMLHGWVKVLKRVRANMSKLGGYEVEAFTLHDLRRTARSHYEDHGIDESIAERMLNHKVSGLKATYNRNKRANALAEGFAKWDRGLGAMAVKAGVADALEYPTRAAVMPPMQALLAA